LKRDVGRKLKEAISRRKKGGGFLDGIQGGRETVE
jgi:hypothetical protein